MDGLKRPRDDDDEKKKDEDELVTMMDVFRNQKELEEEAMHKEHEEWGDENHCTAEKVRFLSFRLLDVENYMMMFLCCFFV